MANEKRLERKSISLNDKIQISNRLKNGERVSSIAKSLNLNECTIRAIKKNENKIRKSVAEGCSLSSKYVSREGNNIETKNSIPPADGENNRIIDTASHSDEEDGIDTNIQDIEEQRILKFEPKMTLDIQERERMNENKKAKEIAKTREIILRKYMALKTTKTEEDIKLGKQYKHIVELLKEIASNTANNSLENNNETIVVPEKRKLPCETMKRSKIYRPSREVIDDDTDNDDDDEIKDSEGQKYTEIITPFVKVAEKPDNEITSLPLPNNNFDYDNWDDPNELVDRLRLLISSTQAGNCNHDNEIRTIIRELRDAGYIDFKEEEEMAINSYNSYVDENGFNHVQ